MKWTDLWANYTSSKIQLEDNIGPVKWQIPVLAMIACAGSSVSDLENIFLLFTLADNNSIICVMGSSIACDKGVIQNHAR